MRGKIRMPRGKRGDKGYRIGKKKGERTQEWEEKRECQGGERKGDKVGKHEN